MSEKAKLIIEEEDDKYRLKWQYEGDEDDLGGYLGQNIDDGMGPAPKDREEWEQWAACSAIMKGPDRRYSRDSTGFFWESKQAVQAALRVAKAALKAEKPMPDWAKTALEHGWKPPKGWKP